MKYSCEICGCTSHVEGRSMIDAAKVAYAEYLMAHASCVAGIPLGGSGCVRVLFEGKTHKIHLEHDIMDSIKIDREAMAKQYRKDMGQ